MDFELSEEQRLMQDTAYKFAVKEFEPIAKECDREEKRPEGLLQKGAEIGLVGITIPEEYGGAGLGFLELALVTEQLSRVDMSLGSVIVTSAFGSENIQFFGTEEQKKKYLPPLVTGKAATSGAYTEPNAGTDVAAAGTKAVKDGDEYVITGNKMFITNGSFADWFITLCVTNPDNKRFQRHSLVLIESDRKGITVNKIYGKMGMRASDTTEIAFEEVRVPCSNLIGKEGNAFPQLMHFFDATRTMVAAQGIGLAQGALDKTLTYIKQREVFGKPIIANQAVQFMIAEMATKIELARTLDYKAAWFVDQGKTNPSLNAMAKYFAGEMAVWVCDKALQLHGGYGYIDEYDVQRYYRDVKVLEIYEGAKEAEKLTIGRMLMK